MTRRDVVKAVLDHKQPRYVPWSMSFTCEARQKLVSHYGEDLDGVLNNHIVCCGSGSGGKMEDIGNDCVRDGFGVVWDRSEDKDIGVVKGLQLPEANMDNYDLPDPNDPSCFAPMESSIAAHPDRLRIFNIGFSLYERAWTLRGMENLMMDFIMNPDFVQELLTQIADFNIAQAKIAMEYDIDAVMFGDDWGQQHGLQMGPKLWREFIYPQLKRMYGAVRETGRYVIIHSCGDVDELFDDLVGIGLDCFNPFQPEVMDTKQLLKDYNGKLSFWGGLSTQRTLPYGTVNDVKRDIRELIELGLQGNYIFAPAHAVEGDVPLENLIACIETINDQPGVC